MCLAGRVREDLACGHGSGPRMRRAKDKTGVVRGGILGTGGVGNAWPLAGPMSGRAVWG